MTTMLGLPKTLSDEHIDQDLPFEVDDEAITKEGIRLEAVGGGSTMAAVNAHTRLLLIMAKIVNYLYPVNDSEWKEKGVYRVSYARVVEVEGVLDEWFNDLPREQDLSGPPSSSQIRFVLLAVIDASCPDILCLQNSASTEDGLCSCPNGSLPTVSAPHHPK